MAVIRRWLPYTLSTIQWVDPHGAKEPPFGLDLVLKSSVLTMTFKRGAVLPYFVNVPPYCLKPHPLYPPFW